MASTTVVIQDELGLRVPSVASVTVVAGDSVIFTAGDGADSTLYFSPATAAIISPSPESAVALASGASVSYSFSSATAGVYGVVVQAQDSPAPSDFDFGAALEPPTLVVQAGSGLSFPGPGMPIKTGR